MRAIADRGITILIIEHLMKVVLSLSQRILVLHRGKLVSQGDPQTVIQDPVVVEAYLGTQVRRASERNWPMAEPLLRVQNLCAGYGQVQVLWGTDLDRRARQHRVPRRVERRRQVNACCAQFQASSSRLAGACIWAIAI